MNGSTPDEWDCQPVHPDLAEDLGYDVIEWICVAAEQHGTDYLMFLPEEEEMLAEDEFIIVEQDAVATLEDTI